MDGSRVLGAVQPLERAPPRRGARRARRPALRALGEAGRAAASLGAGARRRHLPRAQLADHLLRDFALLAGGSDVERLEREVAAAGAVVVAAGAGASDDGLRRIGRDRRRRVLRGGAGRWLYQTPAHRLRTPQARRPTPTAIVPFSAPQGLRPATVSLVAMTQITAGAGKQINSPAQVLFASLIGTDHRVLRLLHLRDRGRSRLSQVVLPRVRSRLGHAGVAGDLWHCVHRPARSGRRSSATSATASAARRRSSPRC